jgi:flagellar basal body-associated protein FliL
VDEAALGTDPFVNDTDGDGYEDGEDDFPLDSRRWEKDDGNSGTVKIEDEGSFLFLYLIIIVVVIIIIVFVVIILVFLFLIRPRKGEKNQPPQPPPTQPILNTQQPEFQPDWKSQEPRL